jgi:hypothetical protein
MSPPGFLRSVATLLTRSALRMIVVGFHVRSPSVSVSETTYFWAWLIQSANGSPLRSGQAAADTWYVRRP